MSNPFPARRLMGRRCPAKVSRTATRTGRRYRREIPSHGTCSHEELSLRTRHIQASSVGPMPPPRTRMDSPAMAAESRLDAKQIVSRLEDAGRTLLALPTSGWNPGLRQSSLDIVRTALEGYGWAEARVRPPVPSPSRIDSMDEAWTWIALIPDDRFVLRRIVGARALVSPITDRHVFSWRRLGSILGADHKAVQRWHAEGIATIVAALGRERSRR